MITHLIKRGTSFVVKHPFVKDPNCKDKRDAIEVLQTIGIDKTEIDDAFAAMTANEVDAVEFGINNTYIRCFNTETKSERKL